MSQQPIDTNCMTITRFVLAEQKKFPDAHGDLSQLLTSIQSAVKVGNVPSRSRSSSVNAAS